MAAKKKLWSQLAPTTKARYKRAGITPHMYNSPQKRKDNADLFRTAMGKAPQSYAAQRAKELGVGDFVPHFDTLPRKEQNRLTEMYSGELANRAERQRVIGKAKKYGIDGVIPFDRLNDSQQMISSELWNNVMDTKSGVTGHLTSRDDYEFAKLQFLGYLDENGFDDGIEDWQFFRELYRTSFS